MDAHYVKRTPVLFFTLEMTAKDLIKRMLQKLSKAPSDVINSRGLTADERLELNKATSYLKSKSLVIIEAAGWTPERIHARVKAYQQQRKVDCVYIDYLGLLNVSGCSSKAGLYEKTTEISKQLKLLALNEKIPVVAMAQLNRQPDARENHRPRLSDLRDSGSIEQDADVVILLHREDYYHRGEPNYRETGEATCIIAKNRRGSVGDVLLGFVPEIYTFESKEKL